MAIETQVQRNLLNYMVDTLGYEEKASNTIGHDLFIESDVERFLNTEPNKPSLKRALKSSGLSPSQFTKAYCDALRQYVYQGMNVAIKIRKNSFKFKFHGEDFFLYYPSGSGLADNSHLNIHSVSEEVVYKHPQKTAIGGSYHRRFDICVFVNGIFFSMLELKHITSGQDVEKGKQKIVGNYFEAIKHFGGINGSIPTESEVNESYRDFLKVFESSVHVVSSDLANTYVARNLRQLRPSIKALAEQNRGSAVFSEGERKKMVDSVFNHFPNSEHAENNLVNMKSVLTRLYAKRYIEREILFYNYQETNLNNNAPRLIAPRPKQKYGVDKAIDRIIELYQNEDVPDFISQEMATKLRSRGYSEEQIRQEVSARNLLTNNGSIYSILKQYAAGFGKTKIMSWEAIMLNEMMHPKKSREKLFNKIILLSDRIDLKQQMANTMKDMPTIHRGAWGEAETVQEFSDMLEDDVRRIIVVNVQKFNFLAEKLSPKQKAHCATLRIAFIIDEIHRSHNGAQNERMQAMFNTMGKMAGSKKNLLIGLTATISDVIMRRFGEVALPSSKGFEFVPFDAFTMQEAIDGGYVLDPRQKFIPIHVPVFIDAIEKFADDAYKMPSGKDIYQDEDYIKHVVNHSYKIMKAKTFPSIHGRGKAMYVGNNIDSSISAFYQFKSLIENDEDFPDKEKAPKVYIVFSESGHDQHYREKPRALNGGLSEKALIKEFKLAKNAIIVVVDKLQTGFDEPTLHTLVLNTERKGIEMVQTLCRVNRTAKNKKDCVVLDYSMRDPKSGKSKNEMNASEAFQKFAGMAKTTFNVAEKQAALKKTYESMMSDATFDELFDMYKRSKRDDHVDLTILQPRVKDIGEDKIDEMFGLGKAFFSELTSSNGIFQFADKYRNGQLPDFFRTIRNILAAEKNVRLSLPFDVSDIEGFLIEDILEEIDGVDTKPKRPRKPSAGGGDDEESPESRQEAFLKRIKDFNEYNEMTEDLLIKTDEAVMGMIDTVIDIAQNGIGSRSVKVKGLVNAIRTNPYEDNYETFVAVMNGIVRQMKRKDPFVSEHSDRLMRLIKDLKEFYYAQLVGVITK